MKQRKKKREFSAHLKELKYRAIFCILGLLIAVSVTSYYAKYIYAFITIPLKNISPESKMIYTGLEEGFMTYFKIAIYSAIVVSIPWFLYHIYRFVRPGLYKGERKLFLLCCFLSSLFFLLGIIFSYYIVIPNLWKFFLSFQNKSMIGMNIIAETKISEYLDLFLQLSMAFGLSFQLPVIVLLLSKFGFINVQFLIAKRKIAIVLIFIVAAIMTPPDVISQIALALPLVLLYEISIIFARFYKEKQ